MWSTLSSSQMGLQEEDVSKVVHESAQLHEYERTGHCVANHLELERGELVEPFGVFVLILLCNIRPSQTCARVGVAASSSHRCRANGLVG